MTILLETLQESYTKDPKVIKQLEEEFDNYTILEAEFNTFWKEHKEEVMKYSSMGNGHLAGAGAIDYNESKILYFYVRTYKPKNVLEIGHASGCSTVVLAKALEANKTDGYVYTCDIKGNAVERPVKNFIPSFGRYIDNGTIKATSYTDAIQYVKELSITDIGLIFVDASHEPEFCYPMAQLLREKYPDVLTTYHEWSMSPVAGPVESSYVAIPENLNYQKMAEREAFLATYESTLYEHYGFYGSCGLGIVKKREKPQEVKVFYRLSNLQASTPKTKLQNATKQHCLENCLKEFGKGNITVVGDTLNQETRQYVLDLGLNLTEVNNKSGAKTFLDALDLAVQTKDSDLIYLLEDDFLHTPGSQELIKEALHNYDSYVTLYDHPDKYMNPQEGGNPFVEDGGEATRVVMSKSSHWKITNSTVMSFAARGSRLKADYDLLRKYATGKITDSFGFFTELAQTKGVAVLSSIPGRATHCESAWLAPLTDWSKI